MDEEEVPVDSACVADLVRVLRCYESGVRDVLLEESEAAQAAESERGTGSADDDAQASRVSEDSARVQEANERYIAALAAEHKNWFKREIELSDQQVSARRLELETVERYFEDQGREQLEEALNERFSQHKRVLEPGIEVRSSEDRFAQAERARQEWTTEVCKALIMDMRKEWRSGQRKVLQQLAAELRAERKAAADALERQITMSKKVAECVRESWAKEIQEAQEELDQVADSYKRALKMALEAKLREARAHAKEQAEFFQREIREALALEQKESSMHAAQLRRMRLAMLKWRFDYLGDAKRKAAEMLARGILAKLAAAGGDMSDVLLKEPKEEVCKCGNVLPHDVKFCPKCGTPRKEQTPVKCKKCKTEINDEAMFCPSCGEKRPKDGEEKKKEKEEEKRRAEQEENDKEEEVRKQKEEEERLKKEKEEKEAKEKEAKAGAKDSAGEGKKEPEDGGKEPKDGAKEDQAKKEEVKKEEAEEAETSRPQLAKQRSVGFAQVSDDDDSPKASDDSSTEESEDEVSEDEDACPDKRLGDCRTVMTKIWQRLAKTGGNNMSRPFLMKLEELVPYSESLLTMYEEELNRHGVLVALDATDGKAEEYLQKEKESQAAALEKKEDRPAPKKRRDPVKPAVPSVRKRQMMLL